MKNLIIALSLFFAIGATAQAPKKPIKTTQSSLKSVQYKPSTPEEGAKKNMFDLEKFVVLNAESKTLLLELFTTKYKMLNEANDMSAERRNIISQSITNKMQSCVDATTFEKIKANKVLFESLVK